jgi:phosphoadenosine phosphosulfate reductase
MTAVEELMHAHTTSPQRAEPLEQKVAEAAELLQQIAQEHAPASLATSFGAEDMVLTDLLARYAPAIEIFTLDTGRLPEETYALMQRVREHYGIRVTAYFPDPSRVEAFALEHGPNAFYEGVELRKACCHMRKVEPLRRALAGRNAWLTGLRREQALTRRDLRHQEWDAEHQLEKFSPLVEWGEDEVWQYIRSFDVPYNALHDRGFPSIGCAPCTRAVARGEDVRAGRWWWENPVSKECGLHPSGRPTRP